MPSGTEFFKHEFDEAIAIQHSIVESARQLTTRPVDQRTKHQRLQGGKGRTSEPATD